MSDPYPSPAYDNYNYNVLFYVLFLQIGAHSPLQSKEPTRSQNKEWKYEKKSIAGGLVC